MMRAIHLSIFPASAVALAMLGGCSDYSVCRGCGPLDDRPRDNRRPDAGDTTIVIPPRDARDSFGGDGDSDGGEDGDIDAGESGEADGGDDADAPRPKP